MKDGGNRASISTKSSMTACTVAAIHFQTTLADVIELLSSALELRIEKLMQANMAVSTLAT